MWRFALSRRWWAGHVLVAVLCVVFVLLGDWQWDRAHSATGTWQNMGYALQWPVFAVFVVAAWLRFLWLEHQGGPSRGDVPGTESRRPAADRAGIDQAATDRAGTGRTVTGYAPPVPRPTVEDDRDDELAAYNAYLARLAAEDRQR